MGVSGGPYIVRDSSLVLELDAADRNSYVSGSTMWSDLSGNGNNRTLINGPTFSNESGGCIVFDGVNDYTTITIPTLEGTINFWWFYIQGTTQKVIMGDSNAFIYIGANTWHWYRPGDYSFAGNFGNSTRWVNMTAVYTSNTNNSMYINGVLAYSSTTYTIVKSSTYNVAGNVYNPRNTKFAAIQVYNRALSQSEISQNYNAQKSRFGLK